MLVRLKKGKKPENARGNKVKNATGYQEKID